MGLSTSRSLRPGSLRPLVETMYDLHSRLAPFMDIARDYERVSSRIEGVRQELKPHVKERSLTLADPGMKRLLMDTLRSVLQGGQVDDQIFKRSMGEIAQGLQDMAAGIRDCQELEGRPSRSSSGFDRTAREALRDLRDAVETIESGLRTAVGANFHRTSARNLSQLSEILRISELVIYHK